MGKSIGKDRFGKLGKQRTLKWAVYVKRRSTRVIREEIERGTLVEPTGSVFGRMWGLTIALKNGVICTL